MGIVCEEGEALAAEAFRKAWQFLQDGVSMVGRRAAEALTKVAQPGVQSAIGGVAKVLQRDDQLSSEAPVQGSQGDGSGVSEVEQWAVEALAEKAQRGGQCTSEVGFSDMRCSAAEGPAVVELAGAMRPTAEKWRCATRKCVRVRQYPPGCARDRCCKAGFNSNCTVHDFECDSRNDLD